MKLRIGQTIIDTIRAKKLQIEYDIMRETVKYISSQVDFDKKIAERILKKHRFPYLTFNKDKKLLKNYLTTIDAATFPKATGVLRALQLRLLDLAKNVVSDFEENNFHPFMIGGTLLGAIRHGGYIPWDDDIDFDIMRDEYERLWEYIKTKYIFLETGEFAVYDEFLAEVDRLLQENPDKIVFARKTTCTSAYWGKSLESAVVLDFFPRAYLAEDMTEEKYLEYRKSKQKEFSSLKLWHERFDFYKEEFKNENVYANDGKLIAKCWGSYGFVNFNRTVAVKKEDIFPLQRVKYEDTEFYAPNNMEAFIGKTFKNYMQIPVNLNLFMHMRMFDKYLKRNNRKYYIQPEDVWGGK